MFNIVSYRLFLRHPNMETPLDVLSRAASFVHANEEDGTFDQPTHFLFVYGVELRGVSLLCLHCQCNMCTILTVCVITAILHPCCASCFVISLGAALSCTSLADPDQILRTATFYPVSLCFHLGQFSVSSVLPPFKCLFLTSFLLPTVSFPQHITLRACEKKIPSKIMEK